MDTKNNKQQFNTNKALRAELKNAFTSRGIRSVVDRKRIMRDAIGKAVPITRLSNNELQQFVSYVHERSNDELQSPVVAWAYMVELDDGLTKSQIQKLLQTVPSDKQLIPFDLDNSQLLEANSMAIGFVDNDFYDELDQIKRITAAVCNDWSLESDDALYSIPNGKQIKMLCDTPTLSIETMPKNARI